MRRGSTYFWHKPTAVTLCLRGIVRGGGGRQACGGLVPAVLFAAVLSVGSRFVMLHLKEYCGLTAAYVARHSVPGVFIFILSWYV